MRMTIAKLNLRQKNLEKMGADALEDTKRAKEEMEVKTLTRMHSIGAPILELDPVVPP